MISYERSWFDLQQQETKKNKNKINRIRLYKRCYKPDNNIIIIFGQVLNLVMMDSPIFKLNINNRK